MTTDQATHRARQAVAAEIEAAARELEGGPAFPAAELSRIRAATARLAAAEVAPDDVRGALLLLEERAGIELRAPTASRCTPRGLAMRLSVRLSLWYARLLAQQLSSLGDAAVRVGAAAARRIEHVESVAHRHEAALAALAARLDAVEEQLEARREGDAGDAGARRPA